MKFHLTDDELAAIRRSGGTAYAGLVTFQRGRRGGRYRPVRTAMFRTPEGAQRALDALPRFVTPVATRGVVLVDATGEFEVAA